MSILNLPYNVHPTQWKTWRPYQLRSFDAVFSYYKEERKKHKDTVSAMVVQATGLGKRAQAVAMSIKFPNTLFLADSEELIDQAYADFVEVYGEHNVGMIRGNRFELDRKIVVSSPQTLYNRLNKIDNSHFSLIQVDECHKYMAKTFVAVLEYFKPWMLLGWTATPYRLDGLSLGNLFDKIVFEYSILEGIRDGYLAELKGIRIKTNLELSKVGKKMGDFNTSELCALVDTRERNSLVVESYKKYAMGRQGVCFACDIAHAKHLKEIFDERDVSCEILVSDGEVTENRKDTVSRFKNGEYLILINVNMATTGFDYSDVGCVLWARPTMSLTLYIQGTGRATRRKSDAYIEQFGQQALVLDFVDNTTKHKLVNAWELDKGKNPDDRIFTTKEDKQKLNEERERRLRTFEAVTNKDEEADLMQLPTISYDSMKAWMKDAPTTGQIDFAKRLGIYDEEMEYTKGMLAEAISGAPAAAWQIKKVAAWGYDISKGVTVGQYNKIRMSIDEPTKAYRN